MRRIPKNLRHRKEIGRCRSCDELIWWGHRYQRPFPYNVGFERDGTPYRKHPSSGKRARSQRTMNREIVATCEIELTHILKQLSDGDSRVPQTKSMCRSIGRHSPDTMFPKNSQCVSLGSSPSAAHLLITGIPVTLYRIYTPSPSREKELSQSWSVLHSSTLSIITYTVLRCRCSEKWQNGRRYASLAIGWSRPAP